MNHKEYLKEMLSEAPIAYDDETSTKVGKFHAPSKTKWGSVPPEDLTVREVEEWVKEKIAMKILKPTDLGQGSSRIAKSNDSKTIFKYNYGSQPWGNQTEIEVKTYEKYKSKYGDILAKILRSGKNWYIQEFTPAFNGDENEFLKVTKCSYQAWKRLTRNYSDLPSLKRVNMFLKSGKNPHKSWDDYDIEDFIEIRNSDSLMLIVDFCVNAKIDVGDLISNNLGIKNNKLVLIDYGFTTKMGSNL